MATNPSASQKSKITNFVTPKRGKVKARIFESMFRAAGIRRSEGSNTSGDEGSKGSNTSGDERSTPSATPPPSAYNSDANPNVSPP